MSRHTVRGQQKSWMAFSLFYMYLHWSQRKQQYSILPVFLRRQRWGKPHSLTGREPQQSVTMWRMSHNPINVFCSLMWGIIAWRKRQQKGGCDNWESEPSKASKVNMEIGFYFPILRNVYTVHLNGSLLIYEILHRMKNKCIQYFGLKCTFHKIDAS